VGMPCSITCCMLAHDAALAAELLAMVTGEWTLVEAVRTRAHAVGSYSWLAHACLHADVLACDARHMTGLLVCMHGMRRVPSLGAHVSVETSRDQHLVVDNGVVWDGSASMVCSTCCASAWCHLMWSATNVCAG
jgi:hypothetical protein